MPRTSSGLPGSSLVLVCGTPKFPLLSWACLPASEKPVARMITKHHWVVSFAWADIGLPLLREFKMVCRLPVGSWPVHTVPSSKTDTPSWIWSPPFFLFFFIFCLVIVISWGFREVTAWL